MANIVETSPDGQRIRNSYREMIALDFRGQPMPRILMAYTSEGWMVTHEGAAYWTHGHVFDGGVFLQRLEAWRAEHPAESDPIDSDWPQTKGITQLCRRCVRFVTPTRVGGCPYCGGLFSLSSHQWEAEPSRLLEDVASTTMRRSHGR